MKKLNIRIHTVVEEITVQTNVYVDVIVFFSKSHLFTQLGIFGSSRCTKKLFDAMIFSIHRVIADMLSKVVKEIDVIYDLSGFVATLDIILSFATVWIESIVAAFMPILMQFLLLFLRSVQMRAMSVQHLAMRCALLMLLIRS